MILLDTGAIIALAARNDRNHRAAVDFTRRITEPLAIHNLILAEAWYLISSRLGTGHARSFARKVADGGILLLPVGPEDLELALQIESRYADLDFGLTDAVTLALCEREHPSAVFTFDRRAFGAYRPSYTAVLRLVP